MKDNYITIRNSDGDTIVEQLTKEQLLKELEEGSYSEGILNKLPSENDTNYWGGQTLIIKGTIVFPVAEQVITRYKIE